jgi:hypothetical protein
MRESAGEEPMRGIRSMCVVGLLACLVTVVAGARAQAVADPARRIAELEAQVSLLRAQLAQARQPTTARRGEPAPVAASAPDFAAPASPLQRLPAVLMLDAGCPVGAVCLQVRCTDRAWP